MPPRRYIALMSLLVVFVGLIGFYSSAQHFQRLFAQSETGQSRADTLAIELYATNDSPKSVGDPVTLTAVVTSGDSGNLRFSWSFGDGTTGEGRSVKHSYQGTGAFIAVVIATNGTENKRAETVVYIQTPTPTPPPNPIIEGLKLNSDQPTTAGNPTAFFATITQGTGVTYEWNFGDGTPPVPGIAVTHIYQIPRQYLVTVKASNEWGSKVDSALITIEDAPPFNLQLSMPTRASVNSMSFFTATVESGTNLSFEWVFSDGSIASDPVTTPTRKISYGSHAFKNVNTYMVTVYAHNQKGTISVSKPIVISDKPPILLNVIPDDTTDNASPDGQAIERWFTAYVVSESRVKTVWYWGDHTYTMIESPEEQDGDNIKEIRIPHSYTPLNRYFMQLTVYNTGGYDVRDMIVWVAADTINSTTSIDVSSPARTWETVTFKLRTSIANPNCTWYTGYNSSTDDGFSFSTKTATYTNPGFYVVYAKCEGKNADKVTVIDQAEQVVYIAGNLFMPLSAREGSFGESLIRNNQSASTTPTPLPTATSTLTPTLSPTATATETGTPTPTATDTATPTPTETPIPTLTATATTTATSTEAPTETATEIATETPTATATDIGNGTIPQPTPQP